VKIEVEDTGAGIPEEKINQIFEPFSSNFQDGLGIGLALCKRIISEHNGNIQVKSIKNEKTIFEVILPDE
jgi:signal transduction histidine kinase